MDALDQLRSDLDRVDAEVGKAAGYLATATAYRHLPNIRERWQQSTQGLAMSFAYQGMHLASSVTLAATLQSKRGTVTLRDLVSRLGNDEIRSRIAAYDPGGRQAVDRFADRIQRYLREKIDPVVPLLDKLRNLVAAHHSREPNDDGISHRQLVLLLIRTVVLLDSVSELVRRDPSFVRGTVRALRRQGASLWQGAVDGRRAEMPGWRDEDC